VTPEPRAVRLALSVIAACSCAIALYALLRLGQSLVSREPDPALVIWSEHSGYFWRVWIVAYAGGMAGFLAWIPAGRDPRRVALVLSRALPIGALLLALQAILVP
jgi:hypothetical protein